MTATAADIPQALAATAGPAELVPVAFLGRTSNERLQDPAASMRRQVRNSRAWLPPGSQIVAYYWDVESGGDDLEDRGHGDAWQIAAATGIPRDGGIADLLNEAASPTPNFAFVVCEDIERSARDTYNSLKLERQLQDQGIPIFATDEPFNIEGINATTILVRRVKQGVAEWYRLQLKGKVWDGLKEHSLAGWNLGKVPIGYLGERHPHPNPIKAAEGRTKTRLTGDPVYGPVITQIYTWRVSEHLGKPTIRARLVADPITYPPPGPAGWSLALVDEILSNPKYTGHQVMGRRRRKAGKKVWMPASEWIWSAEPTHTPLVDMATWDAAQRIGRRHGNVRDPEMPTRRTGRRYKLRSRLYCSICHRRLSGTTIRAHTYYRCPHDPGLPRHYAAYPDHRTVAVREDVMAAALARFFTERVFGPDRAAMLTTQLPASAAGRAERRDKQAAAIRRKIARLDTAETALITELETPADPADPAAQALRQRIRARFTDLYTERTTLETELAALEEAPAQHQQDPTLLDELPYLGDILTHAPAGLTERLLDAFDVQAVYNRDKNQVTIHATLTDATPQAIHDLLTDPRADHNTPRPSQPGTTGQDHVSHLTGHTGSSPRASTAEDATVHAMRTAGRSVLVAGTTVVIGMMGLLVLRESLMNGVAVAAAATVAMTVLGSLTLLPALLGFTGTRLARPSRIRLPRRKSRGQASGATNVRSAESSSPWAERWAAVISRHPVVSAALATGAIVILAVPPHPSGCLLPPPRCDGGGSGRVGRRGLRGWSACEIGSIWLLSQTNSPHL